MLHELLLGRFSSQIENLFYNMAARRKTLQNSVDDYPKIADLISRFAIHHTHVSFSCRKVSCLTILCSFIAFSTYSLVFKHIFRNTSLQNFFVRSMELVEQMFTLSLLLQGLMQSDPFMEFQLLEIWWKSKLLILVH